jgi:hypothetical protein
MVSGRFRYHKYVMCFCRELQYNLQALYSRRRTLGLFSSPVNRDRGHEEVQVGLAAYGVFPQQRAIMYTVM